MEYKEIILIVLIPIAIIALIIGLFVMKLLFSFYEERPQNFYNRTVLEHSWRLPIIAPYSITSEDGGKSWQGNNEKYGESNLIDGKIISIGIIDSNRCVIHSFSIVVGDSTRRWQIIDVHNKTKTNVRFEEEYMNYLSEIGIESIKLHEDINALYKDFCDNRRLPPEWPQQPDNKK
jgi:hypothetical protein